MFRGTRRREVEDVNKTYTKPYTNSYNGSQPPISVIREFHVLPVQRQEAEKP